MSVTEAPEAFIYWRLVNHTAVSQYTANRVYPFVPEMGATLPLIVYQRTSVERPQSLAGNVGNPLITVQLTAYDTSYSNLKDVARGMRLALDRWTGTTAGVTIQRTTLVSEADGVEMPADDQAQPYYSVQQTYEFRINEAL